MKKSLIFIMIVLMAFAFMSCKQPEPENSTDDSGNMPVSKSEGQDKLIEQGSSGSGKAIDHTGFNIHVVSVDNEDTTTIDIGGKNDVYWIKVDTDDVMFFTEKSNKTYYYLTTPGYWVKVAEGSLKSNIFTALVDSLLYNAYVVQENLAKGADETLPSGRSCATYSATLPYMVDSTPRNLKVKFWIDNEFGFTTKMTYEDSKPGDSYAENFSFEVTPTLSNPSTPDGYTAANNCTNFFDTIPTP